MAPHVAPILRARTYEPEYSENRQCCNSTGTVVNLLASPTQDLCSKPGHQSKGYHVPLRWYAYQGSSPALGPAR